MKLRLPSVLQITMVTASLVAFVMAGHFAAEGVIARQQASQLQELTDVALRRSEAAVDFGATTLNELAKRGSLGFDPAVVYVPHPIQNRTKAEIEAIADAAFAKAMALLKS